MAHILCKYVVPSCSCRFNEVYGPYEYTYNEWCNSDAKGLCSFYRAEPNSALGICERFMWCHEEFEVSVKKYKYSEQENILEVRGKSICLDDISYLEIDGNVLIKDNDILTEG